MGEGLFFYAKFRRIKKELKNRTCCAILYLLYYDL